MRVTLVDHRLRDAPCRVAQSTTCTGRRVRQPYSLRRPVHLVPIPAMESVPPAEPGPIQLMLEGARFRLPFKAPLVQQLIRQWEESQRMRRFAVIEKGKPQGRGRDNFWNATNHLRRSSH